MATRCCNKKGSLDSDEEPDRAYFFTHKELKKATGNFKKRLGGGGYGDVYEGKLPDGQTVAVKKLFYFNPRFDPSFVRLINAVNVLYRYRHQNLVTFYGRTDPKDTMLLLVYEFFSNVTLSDHLHGNRPALTWDVRIQIAVETVEALGYLHSLQPQDIHGDVKSANILLDDALHVKVAGWGEYGVMVPDSVVIIAGTLGYRDPEYNRTLRLNDKSDVYSFGVVLMELISGRPAIDVNRHYDDIYLDRMALGKIRNNKLDEFVDRKLGYGYNDDVTRMIDSVAEVARKCLQQARSDRPPMVEILKILKGIKDGTRMA